MNKKIIFLMLFCGMALNGFSIIPGFYGARSLSLGYGSTAFNYDINSIFINPAILSSVRTTLWGYQYQHSYLDYTNFGADLGSLLANDLEHFEELGQNDKGQVFSQLKELFQSKSGMSGYRSNIPGYVSRGLGFSISIIDTALLNPVQPAEDFFRQDAETVTNWDIASLQMNIIGLKYKRVSLSYAFDYRSTVSLGITVHYLNGKISTFKRSITDDIFTADKDPKDYLEYGWDSAAEKFSRMVADAGIVLSLGRFFNVGLVYRNIGGARIKSADQEIVLPKRKIAGLAFRPDPRWGIYVDVDLEKTALLYNNQEMQPISLGIERGFFANKFFVRIGMLNDLTEKKLLGKKSNALVGLGVGFNMGKFVVDAAIGLSPDGTVKNMAVSGFIVMK